MRPAEPASLNAIGPSEPVRVDVFLILAYRNRPCSSCVLRGESVHLVRSAVKAYFSMNDMQTRSRCAINEQMVNPSPSMMRELSSSPDVFPVYKRLAFLASKVDPTTEIARTRHSQSLLKTHLVFRGTSSTPTQESSSSNTLAGPIPPLSI